MNIIQRIANRLARKPQYKSLVIVSKSLAELPPVPPCQLDVQFEVLPSDVEAVQAALEPIPKIHWFDVESRLEQGHICCVARYQNEVVYSGWTAINQCHAYYLDRTYPLAADECYLYSAYTAPDYRRKGIHPWMNYQRSLYMKKKNYRQCLAFIEAHNKAAMRMPQKLGYEQVGSTGFMEVFGIRFYFHRDGGAFSALKQHYFIRKV